MDVPSAASPPAAVASPPEPRQRWRLAYARSVPATAETIGRDYIAAWEAALVGAGLPLVVTDPGRPRIALAAPLPVGISALRELLDFWLTERWPAWRVREAVEARLPSDHAVVGLGNVWLGAPALPGRVAGADYLVTLAGSPDPAALMAAAARLRGADRLPRERAKAGGVKRYDLRPLLGDVTVVRMTPPLAVRIRTLNHAELGSGRPDEAIAALADEVGAPLNVSAFERERVVLVDDPA